MTLRHRLATAEDLPALAEVMSAAIGELQRGFLTPDQIESSRTIMGIDTQLVADGTYYVVEEVVEDVIGDHGGPRAQIAGCGGWSRRSTLYGGDHTPGRDPEPLDPAVDAARVRAMYTHPDFARRGVGRLILELCEDAAAREGFARLELMATLSGQPLYTAYGFVAVEEVIDDRGGAPVPLVRMVKPIRRHVD